MCKNIKAAISPYEDLLSTVQKIRLRWFGHVVRSGVLCKIIPQDTVQDEGNGKAKEKTGG